MNAVVQDAFLGRGTQSPYLAIFNHMGLRLDENAPKGVPDEMMRMIGPSAAVRRLEREMDALQAELREKYGRPSRAVGDDKKRYDSVQARLSTARQKHRRKVFRKLYREFFTESDKKELQKQLQGIHEPVVEHPVVHVLPERRKLAAIMGDMDEDLPEGDIVQRKVEAINAMVAYAFVDEPLQRRQPESQKKAPPTPRPEVALPNPPGQPITPTPPAQITSGTRTPDTQLGSPPPPYAEFDPGAVLHPTMPAREVTITACLRRPYSRKKPGPCIFCGKTYTRTSSLWDHLDNHPELAGDGPVVCPRQECNGMVLESRERFEAHAAHCHGSSFRWKIMPEIGNGMESPVDSAVASPKLAMLTASESQVLPPDPDPMQKSHVCHSQHQKSGGLGDTSALSSPRLKITLRVTTKDMHEVHVQSSPRTPKIVPKSREEGLESSCKRSSTISSPRLKVVQRKIRGEHVHESPHTPRIVLKRPREEGLEPPSKRRIVLKAN
jgi:hypothetical protein